MKKIYYSKFHYDIFYILSRLYKTNALKILQSLTVPSPLYTVRVNTLKINANELISLLKKEGLNFKKFQANGIEIPEIIYYDLSPKKKRIKILKKKIFVDKFTGESISQGANLFRPGIKRYDKFGEGEVLTVISEFNAFLIPVANVKSIISSNDLSIMGHGLIAKNIESIFSGISIQDLKVFQKGLIYDQSLPAIITSKILSPKKNDFIIDLCAAPGGKATHLSQLMENKGRILAIDRSNKKLDRIKEHIKRLGIKNIELKKIDSTKLEGYEADKILIDPPCSALGTRKKLANFTTKKDVENFARYQKKFIQSAIKNIRPGGTIVYSTCTFTLEENELNIEYMIKKFGCKLVNQPIYIGSPGIISNSRLDMKLCQRFLPTEHQCQGFFIAKLIAP